MFFLFNPYFYFFMMQSYYQQQNETNEAKIVDVVRSLAVPNMN